MIFSLICLIARVLSWNHTQATATECWSVLPGAIFIDNEEILYSSSCGRKWFVFATDNEDRCVWIYKSCVNFQRTSLPLKFQEMLTQSTDRSIDWSDNLSLHSLLTHLACVWLAGSWSLNLYSTVGQGCLAKKMTRVLKCLNGLTAGSQVWKSCTNFDTYWYIQTHLELYIHFNNFLCFYLSPVCSWNKIATWLAMLNSVCEAKVRCKEIYLLKGKIWLGETKWQRL